ncbi:hypothetical protein VTL71DRAFT_5863 [Oculimacula yallundae]|uniref:Serine protease n=1 Tax=Oculimacula yallundae TaxID=86028 RepID=A0ABR4C082_9HELO
MSSPGKRQVSLTAPESLPSRKLDSTEESATPTVFSRSSDRTSEGSEPQMSSEAAQTITDYYAGIPGNPQLLARSSHSKFERPLVDDPYGTSGKVPAVKDMFVITNKTLQAAVTRERRNKVLGVLSTMKPKCWIAVDYVRVGYSKKSSENPAVILITVEEDKLPHKEAGRLVDEISKVFLGFDFEVEIMEGRRDGFMADKEDEDEVETDKLVEPPLPPISYPHVGSSIGLSRKYKDIKTGTGTLAGFLQIDGTIYGLTNHHVVFGTDRKEAFPTNEEERTRTTLVVNQPSTGDLESLKLRVNIRIKNFERLQAKKELSESDKKKLNELKTSLAEYNTWTEDKCQLGTIWKTSGVRLSSKTSTGHQHRMDWALINLENPGRFQKERFENELPSTDLNKTGIPGYFESAMKLGPDPEKTLDDFPLFLKRSLKTKESQYRQKLAEDKDKMQIVWKFGRTTHYTYGVSSEIESNFKGVDDLVSDEWMVMDSPAGRGIYQKYFSMAGDSGSFVWDSDGFVTGLLWGGRQECQRTFVTPIEAVLEDIKTICGAKEVKLVVRPEDANDEEFLPSGNSSKPGTKINV